MGRVNSPGADKITDEFVGIVLVIGKALGMLEKGKFGKYFEW